MSNGIEHQAEFADTMERLEALKHQTAQGRDYWFAREIYPVLGYQTWQGFQPVIDRASDSMRSMGVDPSHQIRQTTKLMEVAGGARKSGDDYYLSKGACRLIAMNGDPTKAEIAGAQAYFVVQTQKMEQVESLEHDAKRVEQRAKVSVAFRAVSGVAKAAGVPNHKQALFHDQRSLGLYEMSSQEIRAKKGLKADDNLFDFAGPLELSANEFQMNMAANVIQKDGIKGEYAVIRKNREIARDVRNVMKQNKATMPENLPIEEHIREAQKRLKAKNKAIAKGAPSA